MSTKKLLSALSLTGIALTGCATNQATTYPNFSPAPVAQNTSTANFAQTADNLMVILDASSSKAAIYDGDSSNSTVLDVEKQLLQRINQTIPAKAKLSSGLRSFGHGPCLNWKNTAILQEVSTHSSSTFQSNLDKANCASGGSPLESAIQGVATDLNNATGNIALLVVTDAHRLSTETLTAATTLEQQYGDRLCIYSVWVGNEHEQSGKFLLQELSNIAGCGKSVDIKELTSNTATAAFVEEILYSKTKATKAVVLDDDKDGVPNSQDKCPTTPKGAKVNNTGCWAFSDIKFNNNKASIKAEYESLFDNAIKILKLNPTLIVEIQGHTDGNGAASYNKTLSSKRALTVKNLLVKNGISTDRLTTKGFGESSPIATNDTALGRETNRRVEFKASYK